MPKEQVYQAVGESQTKVGTKLMVGQGMPATITKVEDETVTIDANHPLAGARRWPLDGRSQHFCVVKCSPPET